MSLAIFSKIIKASFNRKTNVDINNGDCYHWALLVKQLFPEVTLCSNYNHAWIEFEGMHYDSEHPNGVDSHRKLSCNMYCGEYHIWKYKHEKSFKKTWDIKF